MSTFKRLVLASAVCTGIAGMAALPAGASTKTTTVKAVETDFHIALSKSSFSPGTYVFVAQNKGQTTHALEITGPGLKHAETKDISPGQSTQLKVTFKKGNYDVFCPVPGHKMLGMNVNLTVKSGGGTSTASKTSSSGGGSGGYGY
jgi:uncharacterized cupredoxin-like copper-binding protein